MENPENEWQQGWKPNNRPQSTVARNFMTELDSLFKLDGDLDSLDKNVLQKKQAVTTQTQELEALEARLRAAEDRLKQAKSDSPPRRTETQRRSPLEGAFPPQVKARIEGPTNPFQKTASSAGARSETPSSLNSADFVVVERPRSSQRVGDERA